MTSAEPEAGFQIAEADEDEREERLGVPLVDQPEHIIGIAEPCPMAWREMSGTESRRHCVECGREVHSLSDMAPDVAVALLARSKAMREGLCVRGRCDRGGHVQHDV